MHPLVKEDAAQHQFGRDAYDDRQQGLLIAFENAERQMSDQQDAGDEDGSDVTVVEADQLLPPDRRGRWRGQGAVICWLMRAP